MPAKGAYTKSIMALFQKTKRIILFDIGSASIGSAIVSFSYNKPPHIEHCSRTYIPFQDDIQEVRTQERLVAQLEAVAQGIVKSDYYRALHIRPDRVVCIISSPWHTTETLSASYNGKERIEVTEKIMDGLLQEIKTKTAAVPKESVNIEEVVVQSSLNGYATEVPLGKRAKRISVAMMRSAISSSLHRKATSAIEKAFGHTPILFRSFSLAAFSVMRDVFKEDRDFLLVDVTGEVTEIIVVRNMVPTEFLSFPYGRNTLVRNVAQTLGSIPEEVESRIALSLSHNEQSVSAALEQEEKKWKDTFKGACVALFKEMLPLPEKVFLVADGKLCGWFLKLIGSDEFREYTTTAGPFSIIPLRNKGAIEGFCTIGEGAGEDPFLIVDTLFCDRIQGITL